MSFYTAPATQSATARLQTAFNKHIPQRCMDIEKIINETSVKEQHCILPVLIESIFGFNNQQGWGLNKLNRNHYQDFTILREFLSPHGPVLSLVNRLLLDPYCKFEFPLSCLPNYTRAALEEGGLSLFYAQKVQFNQEHRRPYNMIALNQDSFEFYFFHFAYFLVNSSTQRMAFWNTSTYPLYPLLLEDYLHLFFPLSDHETIPTSNKKQNQQSKTSSNVNMLRPQVTSPGTNSPSGLNLSGLIRSSLYQRQQNLSQHLAPQAPDPSEREMWQTQTLLEILVEFWLHQNVLLNKNAGLSGQASPLMAGWGQPRDNFRFDYYTFEHFLPSSDHVRIVRVLIKHLHFFVNASKNEDISSPYSAPRLSPMDEFRRQVWPQHVQKKLYSFLKHAFQHWPLDSSFRLVLETWISFIQPWRYTEPSQQYHRERDPEKIDKTVDEKWFPFVRENLLFYTVFLQEIFPRVFRMDLCASKNSFMLFRATKVLNLPNLKHMIRDAENAIHEPTQRLGSSFSLQCMELEAPGFVYKPFFSDYTYKQVEQILMNISMAKSTCGSMKQKSGEHEGSFLSWLGLGPSPDYGNSFYGNDMYDDQGGGDIRNLDSAAKNLCSIFELEKPEDIGVSEIDGPSFNLSSDSLPPDHIETGDGIELTPLGRYQMMNGLRKFDVQERGDPDTQPIRSFECAFLVRLLYQVSTFLNERYKNEIHDLYHRRDFLGRLAAQYLTTPFQLRRRNKPRTGTMPSPVSKEMRQTMLQPRISLRWIATYQNLAYIFFMYLFSYLFFGTGSIGALMFIIVLGILYGCLRVLLDFGSEREKKKQ